MEALEELAPLSFAEEWDNVGMLVGSKEKEIESIYIALDATDEVIQDAIQKKADVLLTHHPLMLKPIKRITNDDFIGRRMIDLIQHDMMYYAMHTNFDVSVMGNLAADILRLSDQEVLEKTNENYGIGKVGFLPKEMELQELCQYVKDAFSLDVVKVYGSKESKLKKVSIVPGSGKSYIKDTIMTQADVMITGDINHHDGIDAIAQGLVIIDAGHYGIESIFIDYMKQFIMDRFDQIKVYTEERKNPFQVI